jgi:hypothetical protein
MKTTDLLIAADTVWVVPNGGTHGSPADPLLRVADETAAGRLRLGNARLRGPMFAIQGAAK